MYTVIICTHIYLYIHTHSFPELLKKQYIYLTCIYLLLDRTMIAYLFHTLFMNINRTEIQHMVHISTNARGKINFQPTFMHSFIIKRACNNIWSHLMKVSLKTCIRSFYQKSDTCYYLIYCTTHFKNIFIVLYGKVIKIFWQKGINIECVQPYLNRNTSATLQLDVDISSFHWAHIGLLPPHVPNHVFHCLAYWAHIILMLANIGYIQHVFNNYGNGSKWSCFLHLFYLQYQG